MLHTTYNNIKQRKIKKNMTSVLFTQESELSQPKIDLFTHFITMLIVAIRGVTRVLQVCSEKTSLCVLSSTVFKPLDISDEMLPTRSQDLIVMGSMWFVWFCIYSIMGLNFAGPVLTILN